MVFCDACGMLQSDQSLLLLRIQALSSRIYIVLRMEPYELYYNSVHGRITQRYPRKSR